MASLATPLATSVDGAASRGPATRRRGGRRRGAVLRPGSPPGGGVPSVSFRKVPQDTNKKWVNYISLTYVVGI